MTDPAETIRQCLLRVADNVAKHCVNRGGFHPDDQCFQVDLRQSEAELLAMLQRPAGSLSFWYVNYRSERSYRIVKPFVFWWGHTKHHWADQWFLKAFDLDKQAERDFAVRDIEGLGPMLATALGTDGPRGERP